MTNLWEIQAMETRSRVDTKFISPTTAIEGNMSYVFVCLFVLVNKYTKYKYDVYKYFLLITADNLPRELFCFFSVRYFIYFLYF